MYFWAEAVKRADGRSGGRGKWVAGKKGDVGSAENWTADNKNDLLNGGIWRDQKISQHDKVRRRIALRITLSIFFR